MNGENRSMQQYFTSVADFLKDYIEFHDIPHHTYHVSTGIARTAIESLVKQNEFHLRFETPLIIANTANVSLASLLVYDRTNDYQRLIAGRPETQLRLLK